jgi:hypothetical protein
MKWQLPGKMRRITILLLAVSYILSACSPAAGPLPIDEGQITPSGLPNIDNQPTSTATINWFPATATWTPFPTIQPSATVQPLPGLGAQVFSEDFSALQAWTLAKPAGSGGNSIIMDRNRLTLAINVPPASLASLNTGNDLALTNFYAEMTITINRCSGDDDYGMLFRAGSEAFAYRFLVNCGGKARVERVRDSTTFPLQEWLPSGDAPLGAPGQVRMGVWASGVELRFFLNGRYQFTVIDPIFKSGTLGVYASAISPDGLNVSFSDLTVKSVDYVSPTPSPTPSKTPTPTRTPRPAP